MQNKYGLRVTLMTGATFIMTGAWVRMLIVPTGNFGVVCLGSILTAFGQVCYLLSVSKISSIWFADNQRSISTAIGGISIALGSIIGFVLPTFFLKDEYKDHKDEGKKKV
jgi:archaellum biogenesis protein FlaJ (TadC family)